MSRPSGGLFDQACPGDDEVADFVDERKKKTFRGGEEVCDYL